MESEIVRGIGVVVVLGVGLQWVARWVRLPSIVLLLAGGLAVGPGLGWVDPDAIFGDALFPVVSLAVGLLLFNGGLELRFDDLAGAARGPVLRLVTVGALATWLLTAATAHLLFGEPVRLSLLLGAILVVSGPTVVGPLLRLARPTDPDATILRWEGIVIDPLGATLGLFCVNAFFVAELTPGEVWSDVVVVTLAGVVTGLAGAAVLVTALRRLIVPQDLEVAVAVMVVVGAYAAAELVRPEAGLFATTAMGLALANQRIVPVEPVRLFGEPIVVLLIGCLFVVLAARIEIDPLLAHAPEALVLAAVLVLVVRPLVVAVCTVGHRHLTWRDRAFLACLAPRGVVAAATAALFALRLEQIGEASDVLVPAVFAVVVVLAVVYGVGAGPAAGRLGVARPEPHGALVVGAAPWAVGLAYELAGAGVATVLAARGRVDLEQRDLPFVLHTGFIVDLQGGGWLTDVGGALIASRDDEVDAVALRVAVPRFGRRRVWVLPSGPADQPARAPSEGAGGDTARIETWAQRPFAPEVTHERLAAAVASGRRVRTVAADGGLPPGAMVLVALTGDGDWTASVSGVGVEAERLIVLEPAAEPGDQVGPRPPPAERELEGDHGQADQAAAEG